MKRRRRLWFGLVAVLGVAAVGLWASDRARAETARVVPAEIAERVVARAVVVPRDGVAEIRARVDGRVLKVEVREGDTVHAGQLLAEIETDSFRTEVERREAEARSLDSEASSVRQGARPEEVAAADAELRAARHELEIAQQRRAREEKLVASGASPKELLDEAKRSEEVAKARSDGAESRLKLAQAGGRSTDVRAASARAAAARAAVREAKSELDRTRLVAPVDGVVLARRVDPGDTVTGTQAGAGPPAFEIADGGHIELRVELEEMHVVDVGSGTNLRVMLPGGTELVGTGSVTRLGAQLERRTIGAQDARERGEGWVRAVWADIKWQGVPPPIGQRFEAVLDLGKRKVEASLPRRAVRVAGGRVVVDVVNGPLVRETAVVLGLADDELVEVRGLAPGSVVRIPRE